jgi:hypothetical protein
MVMVGHNKRLAQPLTRRQRRGLAISLAVLLIAIVAATAYGLASRNSYGPSKNGCVNLTTPSTLGGVIVHDCGAAAKELCARAASANDAAARLIRPECVKAGVLPARAGSSS